jgi:hypothetical protein
VPEVDPHLRPFVMPRATRREPVDGPAENDVLWIEVTLGEHWRLLAAHGFISAAYLATLPGNARPSADFLAEITRLCGPTLRDRAVANVDARHGYTVEFASDPDAHRAEYDEEERRLEAEADAG